MQHAWFKANPPMVCVITIFERLFLLNNIIQQR